jgi:hypothetical protein
LAFENIKIAALGVVLPTQEVASKSHRQKERKNVKAAKNNVNRMGTTTKKAADRSISIL